MKILISDKSTASQSSIASKIHSMNSSDLEALNIEIKLAQPPQIIDKLSEVDLLILGPQLGEEAQKIATEMRLVNPGLHTILFVTGRSYRAGAYRFARNSSVRKIFSLECDELDFFQELVKVHGELCETGKIRAGRVIAVTHAKGGLGATTICAALAECCYRAGKETLLMDGDIESRDLTRALFSDGSNALTFDDWIKGKQTISRENLRTACSYVGDGLYILPPPVESAAAFDFVGHPDCLDSIRRIIDLSRVLFDNVIIDTAGRMSPATSLLMREADAIVVVVDDSPMGLASISSFLELLLGVLPHVDSIYMLRSGTKLTSEEIRGLVDEKNDLEELDWSLPVVPFDQAAAHWPGSHRTLYSSGTVATRRTFDEIAVTLGLVSADLSADKQPNNLRKPKRNLRQLFPLGAAVNKVFNL